MKHPNAHEKGRQGKGVKPRKDNDVKPDRINGGGGQSTSTTAGLVGLPPSAVKESQRIALNKKLEAFRNDPEAKSLVMSASLDNTERKFLHTMAVGLGLNSKSSGKGDERFITITKKPPAKVGSDVISSLPSLSSNAQAAFSSYIAKHPVTEDDSVRLLNSALNGGGMHTAFGLSMHKGRGEMLERKRVKAMAIGVKGIPSHVLDARKRAYKESRAKRSSASGMPKMMDMRKKLPAWKQRNAIVDIVKQNQVCLISGATGSGKSTQVPQFLLDDEDIGPTCSIICTQPRRISAIGVAERIAEERCEDVGATVGYRIRLESAVSRTTSLVYVTPGILLKMLLNDPLLCAYTHIVVDEVHERDKNTDFLLIVLRGVLESRPDLKVILMSATLQQTKYSAYFGGCPTLSIGSHSYYVQEFFLEDVLLQTRYLEILGVEGGETTAAASAFLENFGNVTVPKMYTCALCGKEGFRSVEELGTHSATCFGDNNTSNDKTSLNNGIGAVQAPVLDGTREANDYEFDTSLCEEQDVSLSPPPNETCDDPIQSDDEEEYESDASSYAGNAVYATETLWDGVGAFQLARSQTDTQAEQLLRKYQFSFDDEQVDHELIVHLLKYICESAYESGAILIFLPGWDDISRMTSCLMSDPNFSNGDAFKVLPLHSGLPTKQQRLVFKRPPIGCRKIILSTNIAETSITIDDVAFVIDVGRAKEQNYSPHLKLKTLMPQWISKASSRQRTGRAGRTKAGVCFHLFSHKRWAALREFHDSELLRSPLEEICLYAKMLGLTKGPLGTTAKFLDKAMDPPHPLAVQNAIELLVDIGAFDQDESITDLGVQLAGLSLNPRIGKMVFWSYLLGCTKPTVTIAAAMSYKDPFVFPMTAVQKRDASRAKISLSKESESDLVALLSAVEGYIHAKHDGMGRAYSFANHHFLSTSTLDTVIDMARQIGRELSSLSLPNPTDNGPWNKNMNDLSLLSSILAAGLYPNVSRRRKGAKNFTTFCRTTAKIHQGSLNGIKGCRLSTPCTLEPPLEEYLAYQELSRTGQFVMSCTSPINAWSLFLLCGNLSAQEDGDCSTTCKDGEDTKSQEKEELNTIVDCDSGQSINPEEEVKRSNNSTFTLILDNWIAFRMERDEMLPLLALRERLHDSFARFVQNPKRDNSGIDVGTLKCVAQLLHDPAVPVGTSVIGAWNKKHGGEISRRTTKHDGSGPRAPLHSVKMKKILLPHKGRGRGAQGGYNSSR